MMTFNEQPITLHFRPVHEMNWSQLCGAARQAEAWRQELLVGCGGADWAEYIERLCAAVHERAREVSPHRISDENASAMCLAATAALPGRARHGWVGQGRSRQAGLVEAWRG